MLNNKTKTLLPIGLRDRLPPQAEKEAKIIFQLMDFYKHSGYQRISPPLMEFEDHLLHGDGHVLAPFTFRIMDPLSQKMLGVRSDMTMQIARIATTRMKNQPRPLRLSYTGDVLRVKGTQLRPDRQTVQMGGEIIGTDSIEADKEVIYLAAQILQKMGIAPITIDLNCPVIVDHFISKVPENKRKDVEAALTQKDFSFFENSQSSEYTNFISLLENTGDASHAIKELSKLDIPESILKQLRDLKEIVEFLKASGHTNVTLDPIEKRGFLYHTGIGFSIFCEKTQAELCRGGRYIASSEHSEKEKATGFTFYLDSLIKAVPNNETEKRLYIPFRETLSTDDQDTLKEQSWIFVQELEQHQNQKERAELYSCSHILLNNQPIPIESIEE